MNITHWVPAGDSPRWPCVLSWQNMITPDNIKPHFIRSLPVKTRFMETWNDAVKTFLASGDEWLLSTHNDVTYDPQSLMRLLSWDKPLISALVFMRQSPVVPHIWKSYENGNQYALRVNDTREWFAKHLNYVKFGPFVMDERPDDALVETGFTSTSFTLIHRSVIEDMKKDCGEMWFLGDETGGGEDRRFFEIARAAGYPNYIDRSCIAGHLVGDIPTSSADFIAWESVSVFENTGEQ